MSSSSDGPAHLLPAPLPPSLHQPGVWTLPPHIPPGLDVRLSYPPPSAPPCLRRNSWDTRPPEPSPAPVRGFPSWARGLLPRGAHRLQLRERHLRPQGQGQPWEPLRAPAPRSPLSKQPWILLVAGLAVTGSSSTRHAPWCVAAAPPAGIAPAASRCHPFSPARPALALFTLLTHLYPKLPAGSTSERGVLCAGTAAPQLSEGVLFPLSAALQPALGWRTHPVPGPQLVSLRRRGPHLPADLQPRENAHLGKLSEERRSVMRRCCLPSPSQLSVLLPQGLGSCCSLS